MEYYWAIKNKEFMKFLDKWVEIEAIILIDVTQPQKNSQGMYSLISWYYPPKKPHNTQETTELVKL